MNSVIIVDDDGMYKYIEVQGMFYHASAVLVTYILYTYI